MSYLIPAGWVFRGGLAALAVGFGLGAASCVSTGLPEPRGLGSIPRSEGEAAVRRLEADAASVAAGCVGGVGSALGIAEPSLDGISIEVVAGGLTQMDEGAGSTSGNGRHVTIELRAEAFLSGARDLRLTVCHELVHALMRKEMDSGDYADLPKWAREGLAVTFAGQIDEKLYRQLFEHLVAPGNEIRGLAAAEDEARLDQYFEYALAFAFVDARAVARRVMAGDDVYRAIEREAGLSRPAFLAGARDHAIAAMARLREGLPRSLRDAEAARGRGGPVTAMPLYETAAREAGLELGGSEGIRGELSFAGVLAARKWADGARFSRTRGAEAAAVYRRLLSDGFPKHFYGSDVAAVRYEYAGLLVDLGRFEEALRNYFMVIQLHFEAPLLGSAAGVGVARAYFEMGAPAASEAERWLDAYRDNGTHVDIEIAYMRALTDLRLCRADKAMRRLERIVRESDGPPRGWRARAEDALEAIRRGEIAPPVSCRGK